MGVPSIEERNTETCCLSPKIYQVPDDMDSLLDFPRKKKMFSSSSFYEEPNCIYPTVEEQVKLCRKIAESLSDDCNQKSKGANMFFRRVKKAEKWIVAESNTKNEDNTPDNSKDPSKMPYVRPSKDLPKLKLILAPRPILDMKTLLREGVDIVEHNAVSPEICHDIVKDLNSPTGKGAQLFAKRKKKSTEWVVDEDKVKHLLQERYHIGSSPEPPMEPLVHPRVRALSEVNSQTVAESVIRAAEAKIMTYPNAVPQVPIIHSLDRVDSVETTNLSLQSSVQSSIFNRPGSRTSDPLKFSVPKGWTGATTSSSETTQPAQTVPQESFLNVGASPIPPTRSLEVSSPLKRSQSFRDFNSSPRAWNSEVPNMFKPAGIKSVKPPSVLVQ